MSRLKNRLKRLEEKIVPPQQPAPRHFTMEQVEACKTLCLTFEKHFGKPDSFWNQEEGTEDLQKSGRLWIENLTSIIALLVRRPELVEKVKAVPELAELASLIVRTEQVEKRG
jgi:hypothetical protein